MASQTRRQLSCVPGKAGVRQTEEWASQLRTSLKILFIVKISFVYKLKKNGADTERNYLSIEYRTKWRMGKVLFDDLARRLD